MGERPEFECRRGEDRGADEGGWGVEREGCEESGMWGWVSRSPLGAGLGVLCVFQKQKIDFASQIGEFWCKLGAFGKFQLIT